MHRTFTLHRPSCSACNMDNTKSFFSDDNVRSEIRPRPFLKSSIAILPFGCIMVPNTTPDYMLQNI